jgi:predicted dienelactone hydrolase
MHRRQFLSIPAAAASVALPTSFMALPARAQPAASALDYGAAGPFAVETSLTTWTDARTSRAVPVKVYAPKPPSNGRFEALLPVILYSHGLGGSREGGRVWAAHWASHGYLSIHAQHVGSDDSLWRGKQGAEAMRALFAGFTPQNHVARQEDMRALLNVLHAKQHAHAHVADLSRIGLGGHSFGSRTTLAMVGEKTPDSAAADPRIRAALALSPSAGRELNALDERFGAISLPCLTITGTRDELAGTQEPAAARQLPFRHMPAPHKYLMVLEGGDHFVFGGGSGEEGMRRRDSSRDAEHQAYVRGVTLAFWNAHLKGDSTALRFLSQGGMARALCAAGTWQAK